METRQRQPRRTAARAGPGHCPFDARFFEGTDLVEPGLVRAEQWRPDTPADNGHKSFLWAGVGRKR